jgi:hypothetical protein
MNDILSAFQNLSEQSSPPVAKTFSRGWQANADKELSWCPWTRSSGLEFPFNSNPYISLSRVPATQ